MTGTLVTGALLGYVIGWVAADNYPSDGKPLHRIVWFLLGAAVLVVLIIGGGGD